MSTTTELQTEGVPEGRRHAIALTMTALAAVAAALLLGVWPANFYMAWQWRDKSWPLRLGAIARLPLQVPMIKAALGLRKASARG